MAGLVSQLAAALTGALRDGTLDAGGIDLKGAGNRKAILTIHNGTAVIAEPVARHHDLADDLARRQVANEALRAGGASLRVEDVVHLFEEDDGVGVAGLDLVGRREDGLRIGGERCGSSAKTGTARASKRVAAAREIRRKRRDGIMTPEKLFGRNKRS